MQTASEQHFSLPNAWPFLEIRATHGSLLPYAEHFHSSFSFGLILEGNTRFSLGKEQYTAEQGDIVLIAPEQVHSCNPLGSPRSYFMAHVDAAWLHEQMGLHVDTPLVRDAELFAQTQRLIDAVRAGSTCAPSVEPILAELLFSMQARHGCFVPATSAQPRKPALADHIEVGDYSVTELAQKAGLRREHFSRSFHRKTGLPPSHYLHCLRVEYGRRLLQQGCSVAEAALASGYADQSHFHRVFLKYCSVTPGCYRKNSSHPYKK